MIDDKVDIALAVEQYIFRTVLGHQRKTHDSENILQNTDARRRKLNELETHQPQRVLKNIMHESDL